MSPIYERPVHQLIRDLISDRLKTPEAVLTRQETIAWFQAHYPKVKAGTVAAHLLKLATNDASRVHYYVKDGYDDLLFKIKPGHFRLYNPATDPAPIREPVVGVSAEGAVDDDIEEESPGPSQEFAYEKDLRNYLAKNLGLIESGLKLYEDDGITGVEFPVGARRIDILALDKKGDFVVIELKVSRAYDRVVGQLLRYMGWIQQNQADKGQRVRGVIVAREITEDIRLACSRVADVLLMEYEMSVSLNKVIV